MNSKKRLISFIFAIVLLFSSTLGTMASPAPESPEPQKEAWDYSVLNFDEEAAFAGEYQSGDLIYKTYQVTYVANPYTTEFNRAIDVYKMNIKVPVSVGGVAFSAGEIEAAPMLFYTPWGGDATAYVPNANANLTGVKLAALRQGWVLLEPGMRGLTSFGGTIGEDDYYSYAKLPNPIVDNKAAIRYLRYGNNAALIPGNKERIFVTGSSSGGCASTMIGATGNTTVYDKYFDLIGAPLNVRDDVWAAAPCCPVFVRHLLDAVGVWLPFGTDFSEEAHLDNIILAETYQAFQDSLDLTAIVDGVVTPLNNNIAFQKYIWNNLKRDIISFLNHISVYGLNSLRTGGVPTGNYYGREAIDLYLSSTRGAAQNVPDRQRDWIKPIFDYDNPNLVVDLENDYDSYVKDYLQYYLNEPGKGSMFMADTTDDSVPFIPSQDIYKNETDDLGGYIDANGAFKIPYGAAPPSTGRGYGAETDYGAVYSDMGWEYLSRVYGIDVPQEYRDLIMEQRLGSDPFPFIFGDIDADVAPNWYIRNGGNDSPARTPLFHSLALAIQKSNPNAKVDISIDWDNGHGYTNDVDEFFRFANWTLENSYKITFDAPEASFNPEFAYTETDGSLSFIPPAGSGKPELVFDGWYTTAGVLVTESTVFTEDSTVTAKWKSIEKNTLVFDPEETYVGTYTIAGNAAVPGTIEFKTYQVTYVKNPFEAGLFPNSDKIHTMNIKVPVSYNGVQFDQDALSEAPILFYNPWGGDNGAVPPGAETVNNNMKRQALAEGWVVIEPGMRGINSVSGVIGTPEYFNFGKLPNPIVDLKAALRYLRYNDNASVIPGNKELIFAMGSSSGGCASSMLGVSGNTHLYDSYLDEIGAAPGMDHVFAAAPSCPIITRDWSDSMAVWMRWADGLPEGSSLLNFALAAEFPPYQLGLGIKANVNGAADTLLTADNLTDFLLTYLKSSLIKHLNTLGGKASIDAYRETSRPADMMFGTPPVSREWIKPIYDETNTDIVIDVDNTWADFLAYMDPATLAVPTATVGPNTDNAFVYDALEPNGIINANISPYVSATTRSMGKPNDFGAVFSEFGIKYIEEKYGLSVSDEYKELLAFQRNSVDPFYFIIGDETSDIAQNWWIRSGSVDHAALYINTFNLAAALEMQGANVDAALVWDQGHGLSTDVAGFFAFANEAIAGSDVSDAVKQAIDAINALPVLENIIAEQNPDAGKISYNSTNLLTAINNVSGLIAAAKAEGAGDDDITNLSVYNAVIAKINEISNTKVGEIDIYLVETTGTNVQAGIYDLNACVEFPNALLIDDGNATVRTMVTKPNTITVGMMSPPPDGRYTASVNAGGVVLSVVRNYEARRVFSVEIIDGDLKLGMFNNANTFLFDADAVVYVYKLGDNGLEIVTTTTKSGYQDMVAGYTDRFDWDDELNVFTNASGRVTELFVMENDINDAYEVAEYNKMFELFEPKTRLTDEQLVAAGIASGYAPKNDIRSIDAGIFDPTKNGSDSTSKYPVFIWLQGITNGRSEQWHFVNTNPANFAKASFQEDFEEGAAFVIVPRCNEHILGAPSWMTTSNGISVYQPAVIQLLKEIFDQYGENVDMDRIYISGFSAGGFMTWDALHGVETGDHGFKFAAAAPLCPASNISADKQAQLGSVPIWLMYGGYDGLVSMNTASINMVKGFAVEDKDNARVTIFETVIDPFGATLMQHSIWTAVEMNLIYGAKLPANYEIAQVANGIYWRAGTAIVGEPPQLDGEFMQYYGTIFDNTDTRYSFGANPASSFSNEGTFASWLNKWGLEKDAAPKVSISGDTYVVEGADTTAGYIVSITGAPTVNVVELTIEVDSEFLETKSYKGLSKFAYYDNIKWAPVDNGKWQGTISLGIAGGTVSGDFDVFEILFGIKEILGTTEVKLINCKLTYLDDQYSCVIEKGSVSTTIGKYYSPFDVNKNGVVDSSDFSWALKFFAMTDKDPTWNNSSEAVNASDCDVNYDGVIDISDFILILANYT